MGILSAENMSWLNASGGAQQKGGLRAKFKVEAALDYTQQVTTFGPALEDLIHPCLRTLESHGPLDCAICVLLGLSTS